MKIWMDEGADVYGCVARGNEANGGGRWEGARGPGGQGARRQREAAASCVIFFFFCSSSAADLAGPGAALAGATTHPSTPDYHSREVPMIDLTAQAASKRSPEPLAAKGGDLALRTLSFN